MIEAIRLPVDIIKKEWFYKENYLRVFMHVLLMCLENGGEYLCTQGKIAGECGVDQRRVSEILRRFADDGLLLPTVEGERSKVRTKLRLRNLNSYLDVCTSERSTGRLTGRLTEDFFPEDLAAEQGRDRSDDLFAEPTLLEQRVPPTPPSLGNVTLGVEHNYLGVTPTDSLGVEVTPPSINPPIVPPSSSPQELPSSSQEPPTPPQEPFAQGKRSSEMRCRDRLPAGYFLTVKECRDIIHDFTPSEAVREAAQGWVEMRYSKKGDHRLTRRALKSAFTKVRAIAKTESEAVAVFQQSEMRCWDGLFEVRT